MENRFRSFDPFVHFLFLLQGLYYFTSARRRPELFRGQNVSHNFRELLALSPSQ